ncbi:hypothetical protein C0Q70_09925 [Pomacea canaliculata]|uniref:FUZ/MON1/HPS1 third Longin domain-containing protein n=1 Tax=Pomacea canaliculata TaxID=400727 RepID=A0A2T7PB69_POMCA|nr:hypothetical protein C0Q70_09925 [Pomacea canaliculata]
MLSRAHVLAQKGKDLALERLHVNQMVSEKCVELLERAVRKVQVSSDHPTQHAFLLVNTKLLALYSKRGSFELQPADILLTILLAQDIFPSTDKLEDLMALAPSYPAHERQHQPRKSTRQSMPLVPADGDKSEDGEEEYHSAPTTPSDNRSHTPHTDKDARSPVPSDVAAAAVVRSAAALLAGKVWKEVGTSDDDMDERSAMPSGKNVPIVAAVINSAAAFSDGDSDKEERNPNRVAASGNNESIRDANGDTHMMTDVTSHKSASLENKGSHGSSVVETDAGYPSLSPHNYTTFPTKFGTSYSQQESLLRSSHYLPEERQRSNSSSHGSVPYTEQSSSIPEETTTAGSGSHSGREHSAQTSAIGTTDRATYWPHTVFLQTALSLYAPHTLHCAQILPGIILVVVSQNSRHTMADPLSQVHGIIQDVMQGRREKLNHSQSLHVYDVILSLLNKVHQWVKKTVGRMKTVSSDLQARWEREEMKTRFVRYLEQETNLPLPPDLDSALTEFQKRLKDLFQQLFLLPSSASSDHSLFVSRSIVSKMKVYIQEELMDYRDYLSVKAQRNITMTSYLDDFPGLVHFIYVDRHYHQMMAPSLNIISDQGKMDATVFFKEKIWNMFSYMMKKLQKGYTTVLMRDGDFYFSYFIWFEDRNGNPLPVQEPYKPTPDTPIPGILPGSFYRRLVRQCFPLNTDGDPHCHEMFMMHIGLVTPQYVAMHCRRLAKKLWEMSGEAFTSVNLL